jgi:DNA-binding response OmpR family regulator
MRSGKRMLIVDDQEDWREILQEYFRDKYEVEAVDNHSVKDAIDRKGYDFVLLDIMMPGKNGMQVFEELRAVDQHCVVVLLSVLKADDEKVKWFIERNIQTFSKSDDDFVAQMNSYTDRWEFKEPGDISVLVVDDDQDKRDTYSELLRERGIESIEVCSSLEEAEQRAADRAFDIYLVDICYREQGILIPKGQRMVSSLLQKGRCERSVIIPITTEDVAKDVLRELGNHPNVYPFFYEQSVQFADKIDAVMQRGPFMVQHA